MHEVECLWRLLNRDSRSGALKKVQHVLSRANGSPNLDKEYERWETARRKRKAGADTP